jgi:hypothetical protein
MCEITNRERLEVLEGARDDVGRGDYLCYAISDALNRAGWNLVWDSNTTNMALSLFPELIKYKPAGVLLHSKDGWFGVRFLGGFGKGRRVQVLQSLIHEIELLDGEAVVKVEKKEWEEHPWTNG